MALSGATVLALVFVLALSEPFTSLLHANRFFQVYKAWFVINVSHRTEVQYLEDSARIFGLELSISSKGAAVDTVKSLFGAAKSVTVALQADQVARSVLTLARAN